MNIFKKIKLKLKSLYIIRKINYLFKIAINYEKPLVFEKNIIKTFDFEGGTNKKVCIFAHYNEENIILDYVVYYLEKLKEEKIDIVFVTTSEDILDGEIEKIKHICMKVIVKKNIGYDFGSWTCGIDEISTKLNQYNQLIITNDSIYAPLFSLKDFFNKMNSKDVDFYGMTDTYIFNHHIQSYFICFNKKVLESEVFSSFWKEYKVYKSKFNIVYYNEIRLTKKFHDNGFTFDVFCPYKFFSDFLFYNPTHHFWKELIKKGCPILKVELIKKNPLKIDIEGYQKYIDKNTQYDSKKILKSLDSKVEK